MAVDASSSRQRPSSALTWRLSTKEAESDDFVAVPDFLQFTRSNHESKRINGGGNRLRCGNSFGCNRYSIACGDETS
jgi:hypothetical protein